MTLVAAPLFGIVVILMAYIGFRVRRGEAR